MKKTACLSLLLLLTLGGDARAPQPLFVPAPGLPLAVGREPADVVVGDVNGDGHLDILTANLATDDISVLLGNGRGGFTAASSVPAGDAPHLLAPGDFNGDGKLDLAVTSHDSNDVIVLLGDGSGGFAPAPGSPFALLRGTQPHNHGLAVGDVNRDGKLDIVTSNHMAGSVSVLLGDGRGGFAPMAGSPFPVGRGPYPLALGDVNGDGWLDIATPNVAANSVSTLLGARMGFAPAPGSPIPVLARPYFAALGDLNGDKNPDLVILHDDTSQITVLLGDGGGRFVAASYSPVDAGARGGGCVLADFDGDGRADLAVGTGANNVVVLVNGGQEGFAPAPGSPFPVGRGPWAIVGGDLNGDGKTDLVTANQESHTVTVLLAR